jgi:uncharacterized protein (TIGR03086 family)
MTVAEPNELPIFPAAAPAVFAGPDAAALFRPVLDALADLVEVRDVDLAQPTPCESFTVQALRRHTLAWLQFFAAALSDPAASTPRLDPDTWDLSPGQSPRDIVTAAAKAIEAAIDAGAAGALVVMSQARMTGDAVLAMALGEYLVHGWDLAVATGRADRVAQGPTTDAAAEAALAFLHTTVSPEFRGPDSGFFDAEVSAPEGASPLVRLLCFSGRDPAWASS